MLARSSERQQRSRITSSLSYCSKKDSKLRVETTLCSHLLPRRMQLKRTPCECRRLRSIRPRIAPRSIKDWPFADVDHGQTPLQCGPPEETFAATANTEPWRTRRSADEVSFRCGCSKVSFRETSPVINGRLLRLHKRLSFGTRCGAKKVWDEPNETILRPAPPRRSG